MTAALIYGDLVKSGSPALRTQLLSDCIHRHGGFLYLYNKYKYSTIQRHRWTRPIFQL